MNDREQLVIKTMFRVAKNQALSGANTRHMMGDITPKFWIIQPLESDTFAFSRASICDDFWIALPATATRGALENLRQTALINKFS